MKDGNFKDHDFSKDFEKTLAIDLAKEFAERRQQSTQAKNYFAESFDVKSDKFKKERKFKHYRFSILYIIFFLMLAVVAASWFIPAASIGGAGGTDGSIEIVVGDTAKLGLFDILINIWNAFYHNRIIFWFLIATSGMMGVFLRTGTLQAMIKFVVGHQGIKPRYMLITVITLVSTLSLMFNAYYLIITLAVIVVPIFVFKGYDLLTPILALMLGTAAGTSSSLFINDLLKNWILTISSTPGLDVGEVTTGTGTLVRIIVWIILTISAILIVDNYGNKVLTDEKRSYAKFETEKFLTVQSDILGTSHREEMTKTRMGVIITFSATLFIIIIGVLPLQDIGFTFLNDWSAGWTDNRIARIIYGSQMAPIGEWGMSEISAMFILSTIIMGIVTLTSQQQVIKGFTRGMASSTKLLLILVLTGALYKLLDQSGVHKVLVNNVLQAITNNDGNFQGTGVFFVSMLTSFFIPIVENSSEFFGNIMSVALQGTNYSSKYYVFIGTAISSGTSALAAILPTSAILIGTLWAYNIGYKQWVKATWKYVLAFALVSLLTTGMLSALILNGILK